MSKRKNLYVHGPLQLRCPVCGGGDITLEGTEMGLVPETNVATESKLLFGCKRCHSRNVDYPDEAKFPLVFDLGSRRTMVEWRVTPATMAFIALETPAT